MFNNISIVTKRLFLFEKHKNELEKVDAFNKKYLFCVASKKHKLRINLIANN